MKPQVLWFNQLGINDIDSVGGKNASLGEMYQKLTAEGVRVPNGFAITAEAYSLTPDTVLRTIQHVLEVERWLEEQGNSDVSC